MALVNHLKNREAQNKVLAIASGRHIAAGHLIYSYTSGTSPNHNIYLLHALAEGTWEGVEGVWFRGLNIPAADYQFQNGLQTAPPSFFDTDVPHFRTVTLAAKCPLGVGEADTNKTVPDGLSGIFKCEKFPDFDADGNQVDPADGVTVVAEPDEPLDESYFAYTANPARVVSGWYFKYAFDPQRRDFNWEKWTAWRDYCDETESVDYTSIPGFDGFGLTAQYFIGTVFNTLVFKRIDPVVQFNLSSGAPAVGLPLDNFSVRWEGKIKALFSETYTFKVIHDDGARLWVNGVQLVNSWTDSGDNPNYGTHTGNITLAADQFYSIKAEWNEGGGPGEFQLLWSSASQTEEIIPPEVLYPLPENRKRYEAHIAFSTPTSMDTMIDTVLVNTNSIRQDVDGKMEFMCVEQRTSTFDVIEGAGHIIDDKITISRSDRRISELRNVWECKFGDLDSQFLEEPFAPVMIEFPELIAAAGGRKIYGEAIDLQNMTRWQARKVLQRIAERAVAKDAFVDFDGTAQLHQIIKGDEITLTHADGDFDAKPFEVIEATDRSPEQTADTRIFRLQEL